MPSACRALAIATAAALITFNLEWTLHKMFTFQLSKPCECCPGGALGSANEESAAPKDVEQGERAIGLQGRKQLKKLQNAVRSYTFEIG